MNFSSKNMCILLLHVWQQTKVIIYVLPFIFIFFQFSIFVNSRSVLTGTELMWCVWFHLKQLIFSNTLMHDILLLFHIMHLSIGQ